MFLVFFPMDQWNIALKKQNFLSGISRKENEVEKTL